VTVRPVLEKLRTALEESEFASSLDDALEALDHRSQFNIVDYATAWKVDLIFRQQSPFDASRFRRREVVDIADAGILRVQGDSLDLDYVERWIAVLELEPQWRTARERAG
jgi:hypothetical protein